MPERPTPRISVCVPTYNHARFLHDAIRSVLVQTRGDFELVVVDNASTDDTGEVVRRYAAADPRIRYRRNETNVGPGRNFNRCLEYASGELVKILCSDDTLEPECLERTAAVLETHPRVSLVATARNVVREDLSPVRTIGYSTGPIVEGGHRVIAKCMWHGNLIGEPTAVMFRKSHAARGFDPSYRQLVDLEMWFHLLERGDFAYLPEPLCRFRRHGGQQTWDHVGRSDFYDDFGRLFEEYVGKEYIGMSPLRRRIVRSVFRGGLGALRRSSLLRRLLSGVRRNVTARAHSV